MHLFSEENNNFRNTFLLYCSLGFVRREPFSLYSGTIFESIIMKFDPRLVCDRESFFLILISLYSALALP